MTLTSAAAAERRLTGDIPPLTAQVTHSTTCAPVPALSQRRLLVSNIITDIETAQICLLPKYAQNMQLRVSVAISLKDNERMRQRQR